MTTSDRGIHGPGSASWRLTRENAMLLGGPRALVMQVAHPLVAAAVVAHSSFRADPLRRLTRTLEATLTMVFGTTDQACAAADRIKRVHTFVRGTLPEAAGRFAAGTDYDAADPELALWVHATLVDTTLTVYQRFVGPLPDDVAARAYEESKTAAVMLGVPGAILPADIDAFRTYVEEMLASDDLAAAPFQRALVGDILYPPLRHVPRTLFRAGAAVTVSLLPPRLRDLYGLELTRRRRTVADWSARGVRGILPLLPGVVRYTPYARRAYRRLGMRP